MENLCKFIRDFFDKNFGEKEELENDKKQEDVRTIYDIIGIVAVVITLIVNMTGFYIYLFNIQFFNIWNIDPIYYENGFLLNRIIYFLSVGLICLLFVITASEKFDIRVFIVFCFTILLLGYPQISSVNVITWILYAIFVFFIYFCICKHRIFRKIRCFISNYSTFNDILKNVLTLFFSLFIVITLLGIINTKGKVKYKVIESRDNRCEVILYSTADYYIVSNCEEKDNILYIDNRKYKQINPNNINFEIKDYKKALPLSKLNQ